MENWLFPLARSNLVCASRLSSGSVQYGWLWMATASLFFGVWIVWSSIVDSIVDACGSVVTHRRTHLTNDVGRREWNSLLRSRDAEKEQRFIQGKKIPRELGSYRKQPDPDFFLELVQKSHMVSWLHRNVSCYVFHRTPEFVSRTKCNRKMKREKTKSRIGECRQMSPAFRCSQAEFVSRHSISDFFFYLTLKVNWSGSKSVYLLFFL